MKTHDNQERNDPTQAPLTDDLIKRATRGDPKAIEAVLLHYDSYITALASYESIDSYGRIHKEVDEDMKVQIQSRVAAAIKKWEAMI